MTWQGWPQVAVFAPLIAATATPLGGYIAKIVDGFHCIVAASGEAAAAWRHVMEELSSDTSASKEK